MENQLFLDSGLQAVLRDSIICYSDAEGPMEVEIVIGGALLAIVNIPFNFNGLRSGLYLMQLGSRRLELVI
jgi:hypothetical protein